MVHAQQDNSDSSELVRHLQAHLPESRHWLCTSVIPSLLDAVAEVGNVLRGAQSVSVVGSANAFGDDQLNVDLLAENAVREAIAKCPVIVTASSEEDPVERPARSNDDAASSSASTEEYTVAFDPLDGSSIIGPNWSVGTIVGVWDGSTAVGQSPADKQVASILGVLGPRTTAFVAVRVPDAAPICLEVGLSGANKTHELVRPEVRFAEAPFKTRYFAPANLRAAADDAPYMALISRFIQEKYTLRYAGGLIPDVVHALVKGHGVYVSPVMDLSKAKLRKLYELFPVALVMECAGGKAADPMDGSRILDKASSNCDEKGGLICGTAVEVDIVREALKK